MSGFPLPPTTTLRFKILAKENLLPDELVIASAVPKEKRGNIPLWSEISKNDPRKVAWIQKLDREEISIQKGGGDAVIISLRNDAAIDAAISAQRILIDVTGLSHDVWAPLLKSAFRQHSAIRVLYAEPESYKTHPTPSSSAIFDLSVTFEGLAPLPGFARLAGPEDEAKCVFVATLGFEGSRPEYLVSQLDPTPKVIPLVGAPGFQLEYPAFTVGCNRLFLEEYRAHSELRYARASCPFEAFETLSAIKKDYPEYYMYLALVGTKPHAIGSVLFAMRNPDTTEVMFDYPIKKEDRTKGLGVIHIYNLENFNAY
ncbi:hypothetical protein [Variovorax sp. Varisp62]|uniref:hypothetical protein n=1 Tax=Variovorax sp. Varisp62 TaxID=3243049 RepID=UPI0039B64677